MVLITSVPGHCLSFTSCNNSECYLMSSVKMSPNNLSIYIFVLFFFFFFCGDMHLGLLFKLSICLVLIFFLNDLVSVKVRTCPFINKFI